MPGPAAQAAGSAGARPHPRLIRTSYRSTLWILQITRSAHDGASVRAVRDGSGGCLKSVVTVADDEGCRRERGRAVCFFITERPAGRRSSGGSPSPVDGKRRGK